MKINVLHEWVADGETYAAGEHDLGGKLTRDQLRLVAGGVSAGAVEVVSGDLDIDKYVETQEASEAKLSEAMGEWIPPERLPDGTTKPGYWNGPWGEGHYAQAEADAKARAVAPLAENTVDIEQEEEA